ncbi:unnamed protein product [Xylocopa violacea]|uniref:Odorant receptor n=1 Tax=Xylocopa violacea TaxID=135666 RepID=A0ABP1N6P0_XYLVO
MRNRSRNTIDDQPENRDYEKDIHYTMQMPQWLLKSIGVWPLVYKHTSRLEQLVSVFLMATCFFSLFFIIIPCSNFIFSIDKDIHTKVKLLGPVSFSMTSAMKYVYLGLKGPFFKNCIQHVERDWRIVQDPTYRATMLKYVTISRNLVIVCIIFLYTGGMSHHTIEQFLSKDRNKGNNTVRPLAYPGYDAFLDVQSSPTYEIVFSIHCLAAMVTHTVATAAYSLAAIFVTHICGQVQIQITKLQNFVGMRKKLDDGRDRLAVIVHDHVQVLSCSLIGTVCYEIDWYNLPAKEAYNLILLIAVSQYPPKLTAGKIIELSLDTFGSMLYCMRNSEMYQI